MSANFTPFTNDLEQPDLTCDPNSLPRSNIQTWIDNILPSSPRTLTPVHDASIPSRGSSKTSSTNRSSRPIKDFEDLSLADRPTEYEDLDGKVAQRLKGILSKYERLRDTSIGMNFIPRTLESLLKANFVKGDRPQQHAYTSIDSTRNEKIEAYEKQLSEQALLIRKRANKCDKERLPKSEWSSEVYKKLLKLITSNPKYSGGVTYADVTTAQISPSSFLQKHSPGSSIQSKQVDFCILLIPSDPTKDKIVELLKPRPREEQSINQTLTVKQRPIAISIKTELPFCGDESTDIKLSIWVGAGIEKLKGMLDGKADNACASRSKIPAMPALSMHGHDLYMVVLETQETRNVMYGKMRLGGTDTILGVFQIIAAIDILVEWAHNEYREWFESVIAA